MVISVLLLTTSLLKNKLGVIKWNVFQNRWEVWFTSNELNRNKTSWYEIVFLLNGSTGGELRIAIYNYLMVTGVKQLIFEHIMFYILHTHRYTEVTKPGFYQILEKGPFGCSFIAITHFAYVYLPPLPPSPCACLH